MTDKMEDVAPSFGGSSYSYTDRAGTPPDRLSPTFNSFSHSLSSSSNSAANTPSASAATPPSHPGSMSPGAGSLGVSPLGSSSFAQSQVSNQAVTQLIDDLRNTDLPTRLNSFRKLQLISHALGPLRTRCELLPYLCEFCDDDDDVLLLLSAQLGDLVDAVGGPEHAHTLLAPLEQLAGSEETAVRERAVASLSKILEHMSEQSLAEHALPLCRRASGAEWFTHRISATALLPIVYPRLLDESTRKELRALYANLCKKEETPMVKRAAAANLGLFASVLDPKIILAEFHPLLIKLARDEVDSVRLLVVQSCVQICKVYTKEPQARADNIARLKPIIIGLSDDSSWRVRYMLADKFIELCSTIAVASVNGPSSAAASSASPSPSSASLPVPPLAHDDLISTFLKLLEDPELEVRTSATLKCGEFARLLGTQKTMEKFFWIGPNGKPISGAAQAAAAAAPAARPGAPQQPAGPKLPPIKSIVSDTSAGSLHTKSALSSIILQFSGVLSLPSPLPGGPPPAVSANTLVIEHLLPLILNLLNDDHAEVRLGLIAKLGEEGAAAAALSAGSAAAGGAVSSSNVLSIDVLSRSLLPALSKLASDPKWRVRLQTIHLLPPLSAYFAVDFFNARLLDLVVGWLGDSIWSIREAAILNLVRLTQLFGAAWAADKLLPKIKSLAADKSYVFRLTSVFAMRELAPTLGAQIVSESIAPMLVTTLAKDAVPNVRFNVARLLGFIVKEGLVAGASAGGAASGANTPMHLANGSPSSPLLASIEATLLSMQDDTDADVKFCAQQASKEAFGK